MKSIYFLLLSVALPCLSPVSGQENPAKLLPIIPKPAKAETTEGSFTFASDLAICYQPELQTEAQLLASGIKKTTGITVKLIAGKLDSKRPGQIKLVTKKTANTKESYNLSVTPKGIVITGSDAAGTFYGIQSLLQLIPLDGDKKIPACSIQDSPRFGWRGMMLDVGRHTFAPQDIKKFIDWLAVHKFNIFHWHLTEDQGWRIEIKKYPRLTSVGAYRDSSPPYGNRQGSDGKRYGGYYTQEEIKEIVAYAQARHITIVPEIDMPGHSSAAIASYPHLGNDDIPNYAPKVQTTWGIKRYTLAPKEETFQWIDDVLTEVCELFPSTYIHIGGDEAPKQQWKQSKFARSVMQREGLRNAHELQSYFIKRLEKILEKKGRRLIGWDEIREGGLSPNATMMLWRGWNHAIASVNEGHDVIMSPGSHTYFDHYQYRPAAILSQGAEYEAIRGHRTLKSVYSFNPVPKQFQNTAKAKHILGCQGQIWTEFIKTWDKVEYSGFPRIAALAEVAWSPQNIRDFTDFEARLKPMMARYKAAGVNAFDYFNPPVYKPTHPFKIKTTMRDSHHGNDKYFVFDGDLNTCFTANSTPRKDDHFTVIFPKHSDRKLKVNVLTGHPNGGANHLEHGVLEASAKEETWESIGTFKKGNFSGIIPKGTKQIRLRLTKKPTYRLLVIREIKIK